MLRTAVVTPIPTPYRDPLWAALAKRPEIDLHVYYCAAGKADRPWEANWARDFSSEILPGRNLLKWKGIDASCFWNAAIGRRFRQRPFDAMIVGGYNHVTMWSAMRWAKKLGAPYYMMCETWSARAGRRAWWKERFVRKAMAGAAGAFPTGILAERYLLDYGMSREELVRIPNVSDLQSLAENAAELRRRRPEMRARHQLDERKVILFCGRLIPKKRPALLVRAFHESGAAKTAQLVIVGDGPERAEVERQAAELGLGGSVHLAGFAQPHEMPKWYALADLFVLPSSETWGVAALEALASGTPVILSDQVGCHPDALQVNGRYDPRVGRTVPAGDLNALSSAITELLGADISPETVDEAWSGVREEWEYDALAERIAKALVKPANSHRAERVATAAALEVA